MKKQNNDTAKTVGAFVAGAAAATAAVVAVGLTNKDNQEKAKEFLGKASDTLSDLKDTAQEKTKELSKEAHAKADELKKKVKS